MWTLIATILQRLANEAVTLTIKERDGYYALVAVGPEGSNVEHYSPTMTQRRRPSPPPASPTPSASSSTDPSAPELPSPPDPGFVPPPQ